MKFLCLSSGLGQAAYAVIAVGGIVFCAYGFLIRWYIWSHPVGPSFAVETSLLEHVAWNVFLGLLCIDSLVLLAASVFSGRFPRFHRIARYAILPLAATVFALGFL